MEGPRRWTGPAPLPCRACSAGPRRSGSLRELVWCEQFKLTGNEGSAYLFTILTNWLGTPCGEKPFRLFAARMEIAAPVLLLIQRTHAFGALFAIGIISGAIFFHSVGPLDIDPYGAGGVLFKEACFTWLMAQAG